MSRQNFRWYKRYPEAYLRGTRRLSIGARGAYSDLIDLMFIEDSGLPDDNKYLACALHIEGWQWRRLRKELFDTGKLFIGPDGLIHNRRADDEIEDRGGARDGRETDAKRTQGGLRKRRKFNVINGGRSTESEVEEDREVDSNRRRSPKDRVRREKAREDFLKPSGTDGTCRKRLPFTQAVLADVQKLGIDPAELHERYCLKTAGKRIGDPSAYLLTMAREMAAKANGCDAELLKGATSRNQAIAVATQNAVLAHAIGPQPLGSIIVVDKLRPTRNCGDALIAALRRQV